MNDKEVYELINAEKYRQLHTLRMVASTSLVSNDVRAALSSYFTNCYSEGYPKCGNHKNGFRYYQGQTNTDKLEKLCIERAKVAFDLPEDWHVNCQPLSGTPANVSALLAVCDIGDKVIGLGLNSGGHLSHCYKVSITGKLFEAHQFDVDKETELINYDKLEQFALEVKPKAMIIGTTAYSRVIDWKRISEIANKVNCYFIADIAHVAGLIAGGSYPSPVPYADIVTMTTHKTLRGSRGGLILCKDKFASVIDRSVFPNMAGGPHMNNIAGIAVALKEATTEEFKQYAHQTIMNAKQLAKILSSVYNFKIVSNGTDSHMFVVDVTSNKHINGKVAAVALEKAGIECSYSTIPFDKNPPAKPSGIRLGLSILTTIGMNEDDMITVAAYINKALDNYDNDEVLSNIKTEVTNWIDAFTNKCNFN